MSIFAWVSVVLNLNATPCDLKQLDTVVIEGQNVTIADVMEPACLIEAHRGALASLVIARLPAEKTSFELARGVVKSLIHRRAPGISFATLSGDTGAMTFVARVSPQSQPVSASCTHAAHAIGAGRVVSAADVIRVPCDGAADLRASLVFEREQNIVRAVQPIAAGDNLGRLDLPELAFDEGDALTLSVNLGAIQIEREVIAVQAAPAGARIFVRDESGSIFAAPTPAPEHREDVP